MKTLLLPLVVTAFFAVGASAPIYAQLSASTLAPQEQNMTATNKAIVETALAGWMSGDGKALQALLSDEIQWTITGRSAAAGTTMSKAQLMEKILGPFGARFAAANDPFRPRKISGVFADGDTVIAHFEGAGTTNDGSRYDNDYVWLLTMHGGKAVKGTAFFDSIAFNELWQVKPAQ